MNTDAEIDAIEAVADGLLGEGLGEIGIVFQAVHLPDDVIAAAEALQKVVQRRQTALDFFFSDSLRLHVPPVASRVAVVRYAVTVYRILSGFNHFVNTFFLGFA